MRLGAVLYIVPFMFVYAPVLLMIGPLHGVVLATVTAGLGVFCLAAGLQGWLLRRATLIERGLLMGAAFTLITPGLFTDLAGGGLLALVFVLQTLRGRREVARAVTPSLE